MRKVTRVALAALTVVSATTVAAGGGGSATPGAEASAGAGSYTPVPGARLFDSRQTGGSFGPGETRSIPVTGRGGIPASGVSAIVVNLTVATPTTNSWMTVWPSGQPRPQVSSINVVHGRTRANLVTVPVGPGGTVDVYNQSGRATVVLDAVGYYAATAATPGAPSGFYHEVYPERYIDTRTWGHGALESGDWAYTPFRYEMDGVDISSQIKAVAVNITVLGGTTAGWATAWNNVGNPPSATSTLNFAKGETISNMAIIPVGPCGACTGEWKDAPSIAVANRSGGRLHVLIDVVGFYDDGAMGYGLRFEPTSPPSRIVDTRIGRGTTAIGPNQTRTVNATGVAGDPTYALVTNTTLVRPTGYTYLTLLPHWPPEDGYPKPGTSNVNAPTGGIVANHTITPVGPGNLFEVHNARGTTDVLVDVVGTLEWDANALHSGEEVAPVRAPGAPSAPAGPATG